MKKIIEFDGAKELSRKELKEIKGGVIACTQDADCRTGVRGRCVNNICAYLSGCDDEHYQCECTVSPDYCIDKNDATEDTLKEKCRTVCLVF